MERQMGPTTMLIQALREAGYTVRTYVTGAVEIDGAEYEGDFERAAVEWDGTDDGLEDLFGLPRTISIGGVTEEYLAEDDETGETEQPCDLCAYVAVDVTIDGEAVSVGTMVGVPESLHGTARAAGAGVRPYLTTWWADASDHAAVLDKHVEAVETALVEAAPRLWREVQALRG